MNDKPEKKTVPELAAEVEALAKTFEALADAAQEADREACFRRNKKEDGRRALNAAMKALEACMQEIKLKSQ